MKDGLTVIGWIGAFLVLIALTVAGTWAFRWYTADFKGQPNALVQIRGTNFYAADQPLRIEAAAITVAPVAPKP